MKNHKGITLIALILTIVVLIILAVVTVNFVKGDSIIGQANAAKTRYSVEAEKENIAIQEWKELIDKYTIKTNDDNLTYVTQTLNNLYKKDEQGNILKDANKQPITNENITVQNVSDREIIINEEIKLKIVDVFFYTAEYKGKTYNVISGAEDGTFIVTPAVFDVDDMFNLLVYDNQLAILGLTNNGKTKIASEKKLTIPKQINATDGNKYDVKTVMGGLADYSGFGGNTDIEELAFEEGSVVESIDLQAFSYCTNLRKVSFPNALTSIGLGVFGGCTSLDNVNIPDSVTNLGLSAFMDCTSLKNVKLPNNSSISWNPTVFEGCTGLTSITIPSNMTEIGYMTFDNCTGLTNVIFEDGNLDLKIGNSAFQNCSNLSSITIPKRVTTIERDAFSRCGLTSVIFEEGSRLNSIGDYAFYWNEINEVTIPSSVTSIGQYAFSRTNRLIIKKEQDSIPGKNWGANYVSWEP